MTPVEAQTKMEDLSLQKKKLIESAADTLADYLKDRAKSGKTGSAYEESLRLVKGFSQPEQVQILAMALQYLVQSNANAKRSSSGGSFQGSFWK